MVFFRPKWNKLSFGPKVFEKLRQSAEGLYESQTYTFKMIICCYKSTVSRYRCNSVPHRTLSREAMKWTEGEAQKQQPIIKKWKNF